MKNLNSKRWLPLCGALLIACSPIKTPVSDQYKLESFSTKKIALQKTKQSLLISQPDAMPGYQTEQMLYTDKPYELSVFAHNAWISAPANMLYPLIIQSLQLNDYFFAVASGPDADTTDYRLDTQVIAFQQNFLTKPSTLELTVQAVLNHVSDGRVVASKMFKERVPCPQDTPYGGVIAANQAVYAFTAKLNSFVIKHVQHDTGA